MKKIPTLFKRIFEGHKIVGITDEITPGCEEAFLNGIATIKWDGSCCAIIDGELYKRYDAKAGKTPPEGAIPCCEPDPVTGHWPHWVKVNPDNPADKWFWEAFENSATYDPFGCTITYEAVGPHFQGNPHKFEYDRLIRHGSWGIWELERTFEGVKSYLEKNEIEGIVFWYRDEPVCKIKRSDFGFEWGKK